MTNQNKPNHWDSYGVYAMATYIQNKLASNVVLDLDTTWQEAIRLYNQFTFSSFNVDSKSELDCINDFMNSIAVTDSEPKRISLDITQLRSDLYFDILNEFKEQHNLTDIDAVIDWNIEATIERD
jgi:hypothetical protein